MPEFNTRKVAFQVNAPNKEEAMRIARNKMKVKGYVVSRVVGKDQTIKGYPHKYPKLYQVYVRKSKK